MIVNMATAALESTARNQIMDAVRRESEGRCLIWILEQATLAAPFDQVIVMRDGHAVEAGTYLDLDKPGTVLRDLVSAERGAA